MKEFLTTFIEVLNKHAPSERNSLELIMLHKLQKASGELLCVDLNLRQNISKLTLRPTSNNTKSRKTFVISYKREKRKYYESLDKRFRH